ncbi:MAG: glycoside hydrolase [Phycisphaerae bacterium]|nr:glycoside hydrolase [Phycisphaerae bacterium]
MQLNAKHGTICSMPDERFGYFGWPTVAKTSENSLIVGSSGLRAGHICPWGKTVLFFSNDQAKTWSHPRILNDTPLDDRDCGVLGINRKKLLVTWFSRDFCMLPDRFSDVTPDIEKARLDWIEGYDKEALADADQNCLPEDVYSSAIRKWQGAWCRLSRDGGNNWGDFIRTPVNSPHGPNILNDNEIIYMGKQWDVDPNSQRSGAIQVYKSNNDVISWEYLGEVPIPDDTLNYHFYEPHIVKLKSGKLLGVIRYQHFDLGYVTSQAVPLPAFTEQEKELFCNKNYPEACLFLTESYDDGKTWTTAQPLPDACGVPGHILQHSSGAVICCYSYRKKPYGIRCMISWDEGKTWKADYVIRDDGASGDLGYPSSVELTNGGILTVYYQQVKPGQKCSLLSSFWKVPVS